MAEFTWPSWMADFLPTWLENLRYPETGVGDLTDLKFVVGVGNVGRWVGFINTGWYYYDYREQYNYVVRGEISTSIPPGSGTVTAALSFRPNWGPVLINGVPDDDEEINDGPYIQHHNSLYPAAHLIWSQVSSGLLYQATVPSGAVLIGLRDLTKFPLGSVAGSGEIINDRFYHYDDATYTVYIRPEDPGNITIYADLLYTEPILRFRELVVQEDEGVLPSYKQIEDVWIYRGEQAQQLVGTTPSSGGYLTHTLTGVLTGDWVVLDYWIKKSYVLKDHQTLQYFTSSLLMDDIVIHYETSVPDTLPNLRLSDGSLLDLNPIYSDAYRAGYLFHAEYASPASSLWIPAQVFVEADKLEICAAWAEPVRFYGLVLDREGLPIPFYPITVSLTAGASAFIESLSSKTDGRGEWHALVSVATGLSSVTATLTCSGISSNVTVNVVGASSMIPLQRFQDGIINLVLDTNKTSRGFNKLYANACSLDGIPTPITTTRPVTITSAQGVAFENGGQLAGKSIEVSTAQLLDNPFAITLNMSIEALNGDQLYAARGSGQSPIVEVDVEA